MKLHYIFKGQNSTCGTPHPKTGEHNTFGDLIAFTTSAKRNHFFDEYYNHDFNQVMTKCGKSTCRQFFLGMSVNAMNEHLEQIVNPKADETYNNWTDIHPYILFKNQINTLIDTMSKVVEPKTLEMGEWHESEPDNECGFAACICGHQALAKKSKLFNNKKTQRVNHQAIYISRNLKEACFQLTNSELLASSIYEGVAKDRYGVAERSKAFSIEELNHPHLTKKHPSPADAISYMELVLTKLEQYK